ncbi:LysR family transcriptional regulator [Meridianimarinicoccus aquatilis]|uniref:LysR family transcriptional regulator n=1 Tax=Meridianimarinicoccus aquatilis TaxID=2552766 RepID=A0A4R6B2J6_9RHOB|nr:LysR family transcriptional regulator [Fluviibacterium aquatile]QIE40781.1 LysR family transcriptional regulator [Rhodobacteraceae bacterium SC52]TDL89096.1 LysR family transcriptional regulator [Fluviibacterium aquatile]
MDWRDIPSLSALRAFEATARHASFSGAARELNVTHAAVAQHVRALEADFAMTLVVRQGQGMGLTDAGQQLAAGLGEGFSTIAGTVKDLKQDKALQPLRVSLTPSFAETWLMPRLGAFWRDYPEIELALLPHPGVTDLRRDGLDVAIRFGQGGWPGTHVQAVLASPFVVVAGTEYAAGACKLEDLGDLVHQKWVFTAASNEQLVWGRSLGLDTERMKVTEMPTTTLVHAAVRAGYGLSVQLKSLVERDLAEGRMVSLYEGESGALSYHVLTPSPQMGDRVKTFVSWLKRQNR